MSNILAIVGRPNVGKSTLFNRLIEARKAIVHESSGVTRDRHYGKCHWNGLEFSVIDTGGYVENSDDVFEQEIAKQVELAIDEADVILFIVDVITGITDFDITVEKILKNIKKPVILVVNKVDNNDRRYDAYLFHSLNFENFFMVSAINGGGTGDMLDKIVELFPKQTQYELPEDIPRFAVVGRPNVGKSSFVNALIGKEQNIVTPIAGTTRDTINTRYSKYNFDFVLLDTAGLRKKTKVTENIEFYSVMRSVRAIENSDVAFLLIDAEQGVESQDVNIFRLIQRNNKGVVILINKWDLIEKETNSSKEYQKEVLKKFEPFDDVPVLFISSLTKQRILKALELGIEVYKNRTQKIQTSVLNKVMLEAVERYQPPAVKGKYIKIKFVRQLPTYAPTFAFYTNLPQYIQESYKRYLENRLRENFNFTGVPVKIFFRKK